MAVSIDEVECSVTWEDGWEHSLRKDFDTIAKIALLSKHKRLPSPEAIFNNLMAYRFIEKESYKCDPVDKLVIMAYLKEAVPVWSKDYPEGVPTP